MNRYSLLLGLVALIAIAGSVLAFGPDVGNGIMPVSGNVNSTAAPYAADGPAKAVASQACGSSRCGSLPGSGCCGSGGSASQEQIDHLRTYLYDYYAKATADPTIEIEIQDLGCHLEAAVIRNAEVIKRLSINGREISEIG